MSIIAKAISAIGLPQGVRSVSAVGYLARQQQDGRSGYWRQFFYKMQEEALKKPEEPKEKRLEPAEVVELSDGSAEVVTPAKKAKKRATEDVIREEEPAPVIVPFRPAPLLREQPTFESNILNVSFFIQQIMIDFSITLSDIQRAREAENDEDESILLLLA